MAQAAYHEEPLDLTGLFGGSRPQDHVDRLLLGIADESAGVDHHDLGIRTVAVVRERIACGSKLSHQVFRVDRILRTAEGYDVNLFHD